MRVSLLLVLVTSSWTALGCVDTSPDRLRLRAAIEDVDLSVHEAALVTAVRGRFDLVLELGDLADGPSRVSRAPVFDLLRAEDRSLVRRLDAVPDGQGFPVEVPPGSSRRVTLSLSSNNAVLAEQHESICPADLWIAGSLQDDSEGSAIQFESARFVLEGCD